VVYKRHAEGDISKLTCWEREEEERDSSGVARVWRRGTAQKIPRPRIQV